MPRLALSTDFLGAYSKLDNVVQRRIRELFGKFETSFFAGGHLERLAGSRDARVRTVRVDDNFRGILLSPEAGDLYVLVTVLPHDQAYQWVAHNKFQANAATGALEIVDVHALDELQTAMVVEKQSGAAAMFDAVSDDDLRRLGVDADHLPLVRLVRTEEQLLSLSAVLPPHPGSVLLLLADGKSAEEVWATVAAGLAVPPPDEITEAAEAPAAADRFHVVSGPEELADILDKPFDLWRVYLHDSQRRFAYRPMYNGPARVTGGAGTGKTVVAMHRVKSLLDDPAFEGRVLFTTYTRNLVGTIERSLRLLLSSEQMERVDVVNVDRLAVSVVREHEGLNPSVLLDDDEATLWQHVADEAGPDHPAAFLRQEWRQVVLAQGITSRDEYFAAARPGRGTRLSRRGRAAVWQAVEAFTKRAQDRGRRTFLQLADDAVRYLRSRAVRPYAAVIVDEAQDLHPASWRMLRELVARGPNDLFIVGDAHQRIYDNRVSLKKVGIDVVGRSHRLTINYRTTHEILRWSTQLLAGETVDDLDDGTDTLDGYRSLLHGVRPEVEGFPAAREEHAAIVRWVKQRLAADIAPSSICVVSRNSADVKRIAAALAKAGVPADEITSKQDPGEHQVHCATMHRVKGLEYRAMVLANVSDGVVPPNHVEQLRHVDPAEYEREVQRERALVFVSATRARDEALVTWRQKPSRLLGPSAASR